MNKKDELPKKSQEEIEYYLCADTHFSHKKLIQYGRPEDFEEQIKKSILETPIDKSVLIHLGDICIGKDEENNKWFRDNTGLKTILIKGNHDQKTNTFYNKYWSTVCDCFVLEYHDKMILFSHKPMPRIDGIDYNIHGHLHTMKRDDRLNEYPWYDTNYNKLVSMEELNYKIINLSNFLCLK